MKITRDGKAMSNPSLYGFEVGGSIFGTPYQCTDDPTPCVLKFKYGEGM